MSAAKVSGCFFWRTVFFAACLPVCLSWAGSRAPDRLRTASEAALAVSWAIFMACWAVLRGVAALGALGAGDWLPRRRAAGIFAAAVLG